MTKGNDPIIPDIKPSQEEIALRQKQMQARKAAAARSAKSMRAPTAAPESRQTLAMVALIVTIVVGVLAGFLFVQLQAVQKSLGEAEEIIQSQAQNIGVLNEKLSVTGENANMSVDALKSIVKEHDSEIRKLWDLSNKRNRSDIAANAKDIKAIKSSVHKAITSVDAQAKKVTAFDGRVKKAEQSLEGIGERLSKAEVSVRSLAEVELRIAQQSETLQTLQSEVAKLKKSGLGEDAADIHLKLEDINIRLDRMQNAIGQ